VDRKQQIVLIVIAAVVIFTAGYRVSRWQAYRNPEPVPQEEVVRAGEVIAEIMVHVSGAVERQGVYKFSGQARVADALEKAAPLEQADVQGLNLAAPLKDGQKIVVPSKREDQSGEAKNPEREAAAAKIDINRAGAKQLESLPGVGPALAGRVVTYRQSKGYFMSEEDIKNVQGIGDKLFEQIKDYIVVN